MDTVRFLVSYAGDSRLLTVPRGTSFSELRATMEELCGAGRGATLRCQLPGMGPSDLVTIRSDGDLANLVQNYEHTPGSMNIRAFLGDGEEWQLPPMWSSVPMGPCGRSWPRRWSHGCRGGGWGCHGYRHHGCHC